MVYKRSGSPLYHSRRFYTRSRTKNTLGPTNASLDKKFVFIIQFLCVLIGLKISLARMNQYVPLSISCKKQCNVNRRYTPYVPQSSYTPSIPQSYKPFLEIKLFRARNNMMLPINLATRLVS
ncbi:PREDICTED: uncharacterized protein LOC105561754 [Vollenhovia emeryi]|uniref:uncharacterized protein LOC105561754 n=1 Tax=Vollenhovia emeryi TaxID=411798 RepID=UPI0005F36A2E|nr:PREDICTED: uncharacterized protein LOC105561754 [Vollenhovia emeryi]